MKAVFAILLVQVFVVAVVQSYDTYAQVEVYAGGNCGGDYSRDDLNFLCLTYPNFGDDISGAWLSSGSCVVLYKGQQCSGETFILGYPNQNACTLPCCGWNDNLYSVSDCYQSRTVTVSCPADSYIRQIEYADAALGMTIHCYKPTENVPTYSTNTHGLSISNPDVTSCSVAAHGLSMMEHTGWRFFYDPQMQCSRRSFTHSDKKDAGIRSSIEKEFMKVDAHETTHVAEHKSHQNQTGGYGSTGKVSQILETCPTNNGLTGVEVVIDDVGAMKQVKALCRMVTDPTSMCEPLEMLGLVMQCDNSASGNEMQCSYSKTVGVGQSKSMTETERQEMQFSAEFGFTVEGGIPGLSASMSTTLGYSELVGYEWSVTDETTWSEETTVSATIVVRPYTNSRLEQLVGKCSFYGTNVNYFKQTDVNVTSGVETVSYFRT